MAQGRCHGCPTSARHKSRFARRCTCRSSSLNEAEEAVRIIQRRAILALGVSRLNRMLPKDVPDIRELRHFGPKEDFPL